MVLCYGAWSYYTSSVKSNDKPVIITNASITEVQQKLHCDQRQYCSQMTSYEEAKYFTDNCPDTKMDGDGDGIPCERQFGRH